MIPKAIYMDFKKIALLFIFFIFYVTIGGMIFMMLEAPLEQTMRNEIEKVLHDFREKLNLLNHPNITQEHITMMIHKLLVAQDMNLVDNFGNDTHTNWNFFNSFFFAITVITTVGYGHLSPSTISGRIFCLAYALFGIPMTGILLGAIGDRFSRCFLDQVSEIRGRYQRQLSVRLVMLKQGLFFFVPWFIVFLIFPATLFIFIEDWSFIQGFYYCFITLSTIGFGDYVAGNFQADWIWFYKIILVLWIIFGLAYLSMILNFISLGLRSSRISNVMHSIKKISTPPFANNKSLAHIRQLKCDYCKSNRNLFMSLKRQKSFPAQNHFRENHIMKDSSLNLNCNTQITTSFSSDSQQISLDLSGQKQKNQVKRKKFKFFNLMGKFKVNNKSKKHIENKSFLNFESPNIRRASSLPELSHKITSHDHNFHEILDENFQDILTKNNLEEKSENNNINLTRDKILERRKEFFNI